MSDTHLRETRQSSQELFKGKFLHAFRDEVVLPDGQLTSREYLYRPAFELGRHLIGYELQKILAGVDWFTAEAGDKVAQHNLGLMYQSGQGVAQDFVAALKWFRLAAAQGFAPAQVDLGWMYANGQGTLQEYERAHMWFNIAAAAGNSDALNGRELVANQMTPQQVAQAQKMARDCRQGNFLDLA